MEELIHQFLLQSGYPRASIVTDVVSMLGSLNGTQPNFIIVDPETAAPLAVILVVDAVGTDELREYASAVGGSASRIDERATQGFLIRVDVDGSSETEQVQFFKVWPNAAPQQLSARTFPDIDSLRVSRKIELNSRAEEPNDPAPAEPPGAGSIGLGAYIPGILLALLAFADYLVGVLYGHTMLRTGHSLLLVGAAVLLSLPAMLRFQRNQRVP